MIFLRFLFFFRMVTPAVAGGTVAAAAPVPAAVPGDPDHGKGKQHCQHQQGDDSAQRQHSSKPLFVRRRCPVKGPQLRRFFHYTRFCARGQQPMEKCFVKKFCIFANWGLHLYKDHAIIITFRAHGTPTEYGGLAQLVRAPASHAGGLGFESLILHQT